MPVSVDGARRGAALGRTRPIGNITCTLGCARSNAGAVVGALGGVGPRDSLLQATTRKPAPTEQTEVNGHQRFTGLLLERFRRSNAAGSNDRSGAGDGPSALRWHCATRQLTCRDEAQLRCHSFVMLDHVRPRCRDAARRPGTGVFRRLLGFAAALWASGDGGWSSA